MGDLDTPPIAAALKQLADAISKSKDVPPSAPNNWLDDYKVTVDIIKTFTDIRFRCLVFVTSLTAIANALLPSTVDRATRIPFGLAGLVATLGITVYELRNSQLYEAAVHRAKALESLLNMEATTEAVTKTGTKKKGLFTERPKYVKDITTHEEIGKMAQGKLRPMPFLFVEVTHDRGLALIYGAVLGSWVYLVADGLFSLPPPAGLWSPAPPGWPRILATLVALAAFAVSWKRFNDHDRHRYKPKPKEWPGD